MFEQSEYGREDLSKRERKISAEQKGRLGKKHLKRKKRKEQLLKVKRKLKLKRVETKERAKTEKGRR